MIGIEISEEYEKQVINSMKALRQQRLLSKKNRKEEPNTPSLFESDENFAMIMGYTSGGLPYGVTYEEMEKMEEIERLKSLVCDEDKET